MTQLINDFDCFNIGSWFWLKILRMVGENDRSQIAIILKYSKVADNIPPNTKVAEI